MRVRYTPQAGRDLALIFRYIALDNPAAATQTIERVERLVMLLGHVPFAGRRGRVAGTREMVVPDLPYICRLSRSARRGRDCLRDPRRSPPLAGMLPIQ